MPKFLPDITYTSKTDGTHKSNPIVDSSSSMYQIPLYKDIEYFSRLVPNAEISEEDYNLSVSTYVEQEDTREVIDIKVLNKEIADIVAREQVLREQIDKIIAEIEVE